MVTCQSANHLKTPAKVSWAFKMVSQFGSLGYTIMGKTADLTVVQKTIIDTLHKEGKPQTFIAKEAVHRVLYPSMLTESWVEGKRCTTNRENRSLMRIVKQNQFKNLGELHKEWTEAGVKASRVTTHRRVKEFVYSCRQRCLSWAKRRRTGLLPSGPKSSFQMRASFVFYLETKVLESGGRWRSSYYLNYFSLCALNLIHEFHNLTLIPEINELFHNIIIYWDAPVHEKCWNIGRKYGAPLCSSKHHEKKEPQGWSR